jgi:hypothetical protein
MRTLALMASLIVLLLAAPTFATDAYSNDDTDVGTLLDNPQAREILDKNIPGFSARPDIDQARPFTMTFIQGFPQADISKQQLDKIQADFDKLAVGDSQKSESK